MLNFNFSERHLLFLVIILLVLTNLWSLVENYKNTETAKGVINTWYSREAYFGELCDINLGDQRLVDFNKVLVDFNAKYFGG